MRLTIVREVEVPASAALNEKLMIVNEFITFWQKEYKAAIQAVRPVSDTMFTVEMMVEESNLDENE